jgi:hypothetical protein
LKRGNNIVIELTAVHDLQPQTEYNQSQVHPEWGKLNFPFPPFLSKKRASHFARHWKILFPSVNHPCFLAIQYGLNRDVSLQSETDMLIVCRTPDTTDEDEHFTP